MFDSPPMGEAIHEAVHPHVYMPLSTARSVLLRLSQSKNITLQMEGVYPLLVQLRLCTLRVLLEIDALVSNYCCDAVVALPADTDQAALLHVINVDKDHYISLTEEYEKEKQDLKKLFEGFNPEFYFMRLFEMEEALDLFSKDKNIDLLIAIQKNHSFMESLFHRSRTKILSYRSKVPILVVHE